MATPDGGATAEQDAEEKRMANMSAVFEGQPRPKGRSREFEFLPLWIHRSILMSFGVTAVSAIQRLSELITARSGTD